MGEPIDTEGLAADVKEAVKSVTVIEWLKDSVQRVVLPYEGKEGKGQGGQAAEGREPAVAAA